MYAETSSSRRRLLLVVYEEDISLDGQLSTYDAYGVTSPVNASSQLALVAQRQSCGDRSEVCETTGKVRLNNRGLRSMIGSETLSFSSDVWSFNPT